MNPIKKISLFLLLLPILVQCNKAEDATPTIIEPTPSEIATQAVNIPTGKGFDLLSAYNFFEGNLVDLNPNTAAGVLPYDLNTALFSDYAAKKRFIYVPNGQQIPFDTTGVLELPIGSILIKHFYYPEETKEDNFIETRLLIRTAEGWQPETYEWNEEQSDARRTVIGGTRQLAVTANGEQRTFNYLIPNQNQCTNCHAFNAKIHPIGPTISNLNKQYPYADGAANQLDKWQAQGILSNTTIADIPQWSSIDNAATSLQDRARAYLAVNCSSCHRREGSAANSGLFLEYHNQDSLSLGFWKTPVAAGNGSGGLSYAIHPGSADQSILLYRMLSQEVEGRMPEIGRELLHEEGISLIREWIDSM